MKKKSSGLFNSFKAFVTDLLPFGLNSTVKGTRSNLQRLMTLQIAALPEELPAGEGCDTLEVRSLQETVLCLQESLQGWSYACAEDLQYPAGGIKAAGIQLC